MPVTSIRTDLALTLTAGLPNFEFIFSTDHGPTHVVINSEGDVKVENDAYGLVSEIAECLDANIGIKLEPGANYMGIVLRLDDRTCLVTIPPFGEGPVVPQEAMAAGWTVGDAYQVWVKEVLDANTFTLSAQEVYAPDS